MPSNNHASPTGALPFLLAPPPSTSSSVQDSTSGPQQTCRVVGSNKIQSWARDQGCTACSEPSDLRYEAFLSLLDNRIRKAWVCLREFSFYPYLSPRTPLFLSSSFAVKVTHRLTLTHVALNPLRQPSPQSYHARAIHRAQHVQQRRPQDPCASTSPRGTSRASEIRRGASPRRRRDLCGCRRRPRGVVHAVRRERVVLWSNRSITLRRERLRIPESDLGAKRSWLARSTAYHSGDQQTEFGHSSTEDFR